MTSSRVLIPDGFLRRAPDKSGSRFISVGMTFVENEFSFSSMAKQGNWSVCVCVCVCVCCSNIAMLLGNFVKLVNAMIIVCSKVVSFILVCVCVCLCRVLLVLVDPIRTQGNLFCPT